MASKTVTTNQSRLDTPLDSSNQTDRRMTYYNAGTVDVWLIQQGDGAGNGVKLSPNGSCTETLRSGESRWAVTSAGSSQVNVDQLGG